MKMFNRIAIGAALLAPMVAAPSAAAGGSLWFRAADCQPAARLNALGSVTQQLSRNMTPKHCPHERADDVRQSPLINVRIGGIRTTMKIVGRIKKTSGNSSLTGVFCACSSAI